MEMYRNELYLLWYYFLVLLNAFMQAVLIGIVVNKVKKNQNSLNIQLFDIQITARGS